MPNTDLRLYATAAGANAIGSARLLITDSQITQQRRRYALRDGLFLAVPEGQDDGPGPYAFTVDITRQSWTVEHAGAVIGLAIDTGQISAGDRFSPVSEIGLRLSSGSPAALFDLARRLDQIAPLRPGVQTKAERGAALLASLPGHFKSDPVALGRDMSAGQAFQTIVLNCLRHYRLNEDVLLTNPSAEAVHQARVALRRARSAFSVFKPILGADEAPGLRDGLRDLAAGLGEAREIDVMLDAASDAALRDKLTAARQSAYARMAELLASPQVRLLMLDLTEWLHDGPWCRDLGTAPLRNQPAADFAGQALRRFTRKVRKDGRDLLHIPDAQRHDLRKDAKKLRYGVEFFAGLYGHRKRKKRFLSALEEMQDILGDLNDQATAPEVLARLGLQDEHGGTALATAPAKADQLSRAAAAYDTLIAAKPFWKVAG